MKTTHTSTRYYCETNGRIACYDHIGAYGKAVLDADPNAEMFDTPLGSWVLMTDEDIADFKVFLRSHGGGSVCETCRSEAKRGK